MLFSLATDWLICKVTRDKHQGIQWTITSKFNVRDLDYADNLGLLSHRHQDISNRKENQTKDLCETANKIGLRGKEAEDGRRTGNLAEDNGDRPERKSLYIETVSITAADRPTWRALQLPQAPDGSERIEWVTLFLFIKMDSEDQGSAAPGAVLLLIIGEPFSEEHKEATLAEITKGACCSREKGESNISTEGLGERKRLRDREITPGPCFPQAASPGLAVIISFVSGSSHESSSPVFLM
ncbi:endonuclease-reverse transcriptase [Elysia marginata]|uniref:Endonuclease-reverse transcriptase n=1 Tax=Elysia marginata TaxID=1093978 RepID=A0AAV4GGZ1_9GAST|nr:endonuclease-reverse transcriptase [Elysia marginata]